MKVRPFLIVLPVVVSEHDVQLTIPLWDGFISGVLNIVILVSPTTSSRVLYRGQRVFGKG